MIYFIFSQASIFSVYELLMLHTSKDRYVHMDHQCQTLGKIFTGLKQKLLLSFTVIWDVYWSFNTNKATSTRCCLTQWISKLHRSFEIHRIIQCLLNSWVWRKSKRNSLQDRANFHRARAWQIVLIFTRGQYWPSGIVIAWVCLCVCVSVNFFCPSDNSSHIPARIIKLG